jgi:hypothetical protein
VASRSDRSRALELKRIDRRCTESGRTQRAGGADAALQREGGHLYTRQSEPRIGAREAFNLRTPFNRQGSKMKKFSVCGFLGALAATGCGGDETESMGKGTVDVASLEDEGVQAAVEADVAAIGVPMSAPFPAGSKAEIEDEMLGAASLVVSSPTGTSADLADGIVVDGEPSAPGEFNWELDDDRTTLTISFYNETVNGMSMKPGTEYTATLQIAENEFTGEVPATTFTVTVD